MAAPGDTWRLSGFPRQHVPLALRVPGEAIAAAARAYLGAPWRHMGRDRHGMDCVGLVLAALRDVGHPVRDAGDYPAGLRGSPVVQAIAARGGRRVFVDAAQVGDVLLMADGRHEGHLGVMSRLPGGRPGVVHASAKARRVVEEPLAWETLRSLRGAWRAPAAERAP